MELKQYWKIVRRRIWIVIAITIITAAASFVYSPEAKISYVASVRMLVSVPNEPKMGEYYSYDKYYSWLSSEYLSDDLAEVVKSHAFLQDIKSELGDDAMYGGSIVGERISEKTHRILTMRVTHNSREQAEKMAAAAAAVIEKKGKEYFAQLGSENAIVRVIDPPSVFRQGSAARNYFDIGLRTSLGFIIGLALTFLLHYLDSAIYEAEEVERLLDIPVLGEIPKKAR